MTIHYPYVERPKRTRKISFDGLGKFDWAGAIGTAASAYTGQPNALNNPQAAINASLQRPTPIMNNDMPAPNMQPLAVPYYKKPLVIVAGAAAVAVLGFMFMRGRRGRR